MPSRSLRQHVLAALVRRFGALVGVRVQTLFGTACEILERAGTSPLPGRLLFPVLVRQEARREGVLREALDELRDGYGVVAATVADLLDADLRAGSAAALARRLAGASTARARGAALVRVAGSVAQRLRETGLQRSADVFTAAADALRRDPALLPARALLVHGFADATAAASGLIETLLAHAAGTILLDRPMDPAASAPSEAGTRFGARFRARLEPGTRPDAVRTTAPPACAARQLLEAPGSDAELRGVAERIAAELERGVAPETIGVVARTLEPCALALRRHFERLGIPFSGLAARGARGAVGRRARALAELLRQGPRVAVDLWLEALGERHRLAADAIDLRIAAHQLGCGRLGELGALALADVLPDGGGLALAVRRGLEVREADGEERAQARRRRVARDRLEQAVADARALVERLDGWPAHASAAAHVERLRALATDDLGWSDGAALPLVSALADQLPEAFALERDDFVLAALQLARDEGREPLGGEGGGVQVLDVTEARARTFEHLFVIGLNRDVFPRIVSEDPLLPDELRRELLDALPDLPLKRLGVEEERFLFAQLLEASPRITLSWQLCDDEGRPRSPSPLVERLRLADANGSPERVPWLYAQPLDAGGPRPADEHALLAGLYGARAGLTERLACAFEALGETAEDAAELARVRVAILDELDPDRRTPQGARRARELGPWFGFVGPVREPGDPRKSDLYVTTLETLASCPWRAFVARLLRIEPPPDALDALPALDALRVGSVVHAALERIAREATGPPPPSLDEALRGTARAVAWPEAEALEALVRAEAERLLREDGIVLPGFAGALVEVALPFLEAAHQRDWSRPLPVLGAEVTGRLQLELDGDSRAICFKADRVDRLDAGPRLTDYKTGRVEAVTEKGFLADLRRGRRLQAAAYRLGAGAEGAEGRFLYLEPEVEAAKSVASAGGPAFDDAFREAARPLLRLLDAGSFFPRLVEPGKTDEPRSCEWCPVAQACVRGDSGLRARLEGWEKAREESGVPASAALEALHAVWGLGLEKKKETGR